MSNNQHFIFPPGPASSQNLSEKDFLRMNEEGPPPYFPNDPSASAPPATNFANLSSQNEDKNPIQNLPTSGGASNLDLPELPTVPSDTPTHSGLLMKKRTTTRMKTLTLMI